MMKEVMAKNMFTSYLIREKQVKVNLLQYVDGILFLGKATLRNALTIKSMKRRFELVSGLKVNFYKSCFEALGVERGEVVRFAKVLNQSPPFAFNILGYPIGANPRREETWKPIRKIQKRSLSLGNTNLYPLLVELS